MSPTAKTAVMWAAIAVAAASWVLNGRDTPSAQAAPPRLAHERQLPEGPTVQRFKVGGNEVLVLDVTSAIPGGYSDSQRCYVWRDLELQTASMTCAQGFDAPAEAADGQAAIERH